MLTGEAFKVNPVPSFVFTDTKKVNRLIVRWEMSCHLKRRAYVQVG